MTTTEISRCQSALSVLLGAKLIDARLFVSLSRSLEQKRANIRVLKRELKKSLEENL